MIKSNYYISLTLLISIVLIGCSDPKPETELEAKCEALMEMYPNYESNDVAYAALNDSVANYCESFVGRAATILNGIEFDYVETFESKDDGHHSALFRGREFCEIDAKGGKTKYIISSPQIMVLGPIPEDVVATLDGNQLYSLSGVVHAWDGKNMLGHEGVMTTADISFGTFILDTMTVARIEK